MYYTSKWATHQHQYLVNIHVTQGRRDLSFTSKLGYSLTLKAHPRIGLDHVTVVAMDTDGYLACI